MRKFHSLILVLIIFACGPSRQSEEQALLDSLDNVTQTLTYNWQNTGTSANVNQATSPSGGSATLTISDADGTQVYSRNLSETGTFQTDAGAAGSWTIVVELSGASGTFNFRVQKP